MYFYTKGYLIPSVLDNYTKLLPSYLNFQSVNIQNLEYVGALFWLEVKTERPQGSLCHSLVLYISLVLRYITRTHVFVLLPLLLNIQCLYCQGGLWMTKHSAVVDTLSKNHSTQSQDSAYL